MEIEDNSCNWPSSLCKECNPQPTIHGGRDTQLKRSFPLSFYQTDAIQIIIDVMHARVKPFNLKCRCKPPEIGIHNDRFHFGATPWNISEYWQIPLCTKRETYYLRSRHFIGAQKRAFLVWASCQLMLDMGNQYCSLPAIGILNAVMCHHYFSFFMHQEC